MRPVEAKRHRRLVLPENYWEDWRPPLLGGLAPAVESGPRARGEGALARGLRDAERAVPHPVA